MPKGPSFNRVPPQNLESEKAVLGSVMLRPESIHEILDSLGAESFYSERHRLIWQTMLELLSKNEPIDIVSLSGKLKEKGLLEAVGGSSYLAELVSMVPSAANIKYYGETVHRKHILRELIRASEEINELGYSEHEEIESLVDQAEQRLYNISNTGASRKYYAMKDMLGEAWERLERIHEHKNTLRGVSTGFPELDSMLSGFQKSDLIVLAARPSVGKTALALDIARRAATENNTAVCVFSLEMSSHQLVDRMLAAESNVNSWHLRTGRLSKDEEFERIRTSLDRLAKAPIFIDDQPGNNILKMRSVARRLKREKNLGLVIVDYLQLMTPINTKNSDSAVQQVTELSRSLKHLARELDLPVLALSQLSRAVEARGGKPRLSDLRDSGCLAAETLIQRADTGEQVSIASLVGKTNIPVLSLTKNGKLVSTKMSKVFVSGTKKLYRIELASGKSVRASANHPFLTIRGWNRLDTLAPGVALATPRLERIAAVLADETLAQLSASDVYWDEITSITEEGEEKVYDATVPEHHNFLANNILVHNSIEQDADVVMFIHREDRNKEQAERTNIAEILIEKHRNGPTGMVQLYFNGERSTFQSIDKSNFGSFAEGPTAAF